MLSDAPAPDEEEKSLRTLSSLSLPARSSSGRRSAFDDATASAAGVAAAFPPQEEEQELALGTLPCHAKTLAGPATRVDAVPRSGLLGTDPDEHLAGEVLCERHSPIDCELLTQPQVLLEGDIECSAKLLRLRSGWKCRSQLGLNLGWQPLLDF